MEAAIIVFIIICIFYGPIYVLAVLLTLGAATSPGTRDTMSATLATFIMLLLSTPFVFAGYMAFVGK
jgi:hypothetical protein